MAKYARISSSQAIILHRWFFKFCTDDFDWTIPVASSDSPKEQQWQTALQLAMALKTWSPATYSVTWHGRWVGGVTSNQLSYGKLDIKNNWLVKHVGTRNMEYSLLTTRHGFTKHLLEHIPLCRESNLFACARSKVSDRSHRSLSMWKDRVHTPPTCPNTTPIGRSWWLLGALVGIGSMPCTSLSLRFQKDEGLGQKENPFYLFHL